MSSDNLFTSAKFMGYGMAEETSEPDSPKIGKTCKISSTTALNIFCKPLPIFPVDNNAPFHYAWIFKMRSHIL